MRFWTETRGEAELETELGLDTRAGGETGLDRTGGLTQTRSKNMGLETSCMFACHTTVLLSAFVRHVQTLHLALSRLSSTSGSGIAEATGLVTMHRTT